MFASAPDPYIREPRYLSPTETDEGLPPYQIECLTHALTVLVDTVNDGYRPREHFSQDG